MDCPPRLCHLQHLTHNLLQTHKLYLGRFILTVRIKHSFNPVNVKTFVYSSIISELQNFQQCCHFLQLPNYSSNKNLPLSSCSSQSNTNSYEALSHLTFKKSALNSLLSRLHPLAHSPLMHHSFSQQKGHLIQQPSLENSIPKHFPKHLYHSAPCVKQNPIVLPSLSLAIFLLHSVLLLVLDLKNADQPFASTDAA